MADLDLGEATPEWLDRALRVHDPVRTVALPRTPEMARMWYLGRKLGVLLHEPARIEGDTVVVRTFETLGLEQVSWLLAARIVVDGRPHAFDSLDTDLPHAGGSAPVRITYRAV